MKRNRCLQWQSSLRQLASLKHLDVLRDQGQHLGLPTHDIPVAKSFWAFYPQTV